MGASSAIQLVQTFCQETGLPSPSALVGTQDAHSVQLLALLKRTGRELYRFKFPVQNIRVSWTSTAGEDQGALTTVFGADFLSIVPNTFWDETLRRPIYGPTPDADWEALKALVNPGPFYRYAVKQNRIRILPAMVAGHRLAVTYYSSYTILDGTSGTLKSDLVADSDKFIYPDDLMLSGIEWLWKKAKGEDWNTDYTIWLNRVMKEVAASGMPTLRLDNNSPQVVPGIIVPAGNWMTP